jgi:peptidoglycan-associated lipoprotein
MKALLKYGAVLVCGFALAGCNDVHRETGCMGSPPLSDIEIAATFITNAGDKVFFVTNSSVLTSEGLATLERQASWLGHYTQFRIMVEGHADERGTREYNLALGERRAHASQQVLIAAGVSPERITTISYGKERPAKTGNDESAWSQNRRTVTVLSR